MGEAIFEETMAEIFQKQWKIPFYWGIPSIQNKKEIHTEIGKIQNTREKDATSHQKKKRQVTSKEAQLLWADITAIIHVR